MSSLLKKAHKKIEKTTKPPGVQNLEEREKRLELREKEFEER
jgi:hypothetical protein